MTEIEFSILSRQVLHQRISDVPMLTQVVSSWEAQRNAEQTTVHWRFTPETARQKLVRLYPSI
jgi:hypothetical protein